MIQTKTLHAEPAAEVIKAIWNDLVNVLKAEWISVKGTSERYM